MTRQRSLNVIGAFALSVVDCIDAALSEVSDRPRSELTALIAVRQCEEFTVGWLATTLALTHSAAVRIVDRLERDALIRRTPQENRRFVGLALTQRGAKLADALLSRREAALQHVMEGLGDHRLAQLAEVLGGSFAQITHSDADAYRHCRLCHVTACKACPVDAAAAGLAAIVAGPRPPGK